MTSPNDGLRYDGLKVFTATTVDRRERLGDDITMWVRSHPELTLVRTTVMQSSDARFHCLSVVVFWRHS